MRYNTVLLQPANATFTTASLGSTPATTGDIRLSNGGTIFARNSTNAGNLQLLSLNTSNQVVLGDNSTDVLFAKALVALGAGGAATLGLVGGSGPATTTQNTWMRWVDSGGNTFWVPVWK